MQTITNGYRAIGLLIDINWDRFVYPSAVVAGLVIGAYISSLIH
ncbi:hypothetical protein [Shimia sp. MMG029]|nr:hypothetical protein [Shimia sp. MMG029]MDA5555462.1 hypothetical protein [Shimia sp. MMG029]